MFDRFTDVLLRHFILLMLAILALATVLLSAFPIAQAPGYHDFADVSHWHGFTGMGDILSNFPYALVSALPILQILRGPVQARELYYLAFFLATGTVAITSTAYHLDPQNFTVLPDRIIIIMSGIFLMGIAITPLLSHRQALSAMYIGALYGVLGLMWWYYTAEHGVESFGPYAFCQVFILLSVLLFAVIRVRRGLPAKYLFAAVGFYVLSKPLEAMDVQLYEALHHTLSGHTLKHLVIVPAVVMVHLHMLAERRADVT